MVLMKHGRISMRDLIESGFRVAVVKDATAAAILPGLNGMKQP
jgi:nicotinamidase-related amidase